MAFNNEIEKTKKEIEVLTAKLALLEEMERTKSPVEEAYKKVYGVYPTNEITYNSMWGVFQKGYYAAQEDYKVGYIQEPEKSKINDLAEKLLPDDHPYKIADEHGETNPYLQYLNSVEDEKKMEELGFVKNSDGNWTAQPLGEPSQEEVKKLQEKDWEIKVETDYLIGKARHKTKIVDKDGNDYQPKPHTTEELFKPNWEPKSQEPEEVAEGLSTAFREAVKQGVVSSVDKRQTPTKSQSLYDICMTWWERVFDNNDDMETCIDDLVDNIDYWLPTEHETNSYKWNECIRTIREKLR